MSVSSSKNSTPFISKRKAGANCRGVGFTLHEVDSLLESCETIFPTTPEKWDRVYRNHAAAFPAAERSTDSLKRKFQSLYRKRIAPTDPKCPPEVRRAKLIKKEISTRLDATTGASESEQEDEVENHFKIQNMRECVNEYGSAAAPGSGETPGVAANHTLAAAHGVAANQVVATKPGVAVNTGVATTTGANTNYGIVAAQGVSANHGPIATQTAATTHGVPANHGVVATQRVPAIPGNVTNQGVVANPVVTANPVVAANPEAASKPEVIGVDSETNSTHATYNNLKDAAAFALIDSLATPPKTSKQTQEKNPLGCRNVTDTTAAIEQDTCRHFTVPSLPARPTREIGIVTGEGQETYAQPARKRKKTYVEEEGTNDVFYDFMKMMLVMEERRRDEEARRYERWEKMEMERRAEEREREAARIKAEEIRHENTNKQLMLMMQMSMNVILGAFARNGQQTAESTFRTINESLTSIESKKSDKGDNGST